MCIKRFSYCNCIISGKNTQGFLLIELLVALVVLVALAGACTQIFLQTTDILVRAKQLEEAVALALNIQNAQRVGIPVSIPPQFHVTQQAQRPYSGIPYQREHIIISWSQPSGAQRQIELEGGTWSTA